MKKPESDQPTSKMPEIPVEVQDAWHFAFVIAGGLWELISEGSGSDEGYSPKALKALEISASELERHMETVDLFFNPKEEE